MVLAGPEYYGAADPKRIGIMGGSYGGYMVTAGLTEYPDLFAAGADLFGIVNFETFQERRALDGRDLEDRVRRPRQGGRSPRRLSPIYKIDRVTAATIVLHGANDTNVPVVEAEQVVDSLKKRGIPSSTSSFPTRDTAGGRPRTASGQPLR